APGVTVALAPDDRAAATGALDEKVRLWDVARGEERPGPAVTNDFGEGLTFSPDGKALAWAGKTGDVGLVGVRDRQTGKDDISQGIPFSIGPALTFGGPRRLATGGWDGTLALWDLGPLRVRARLPG